MPLFHIQDFDRPAHVVAVDYEDAIAKWRRAVVAENEGDPGNLPDGVAVICYDDELIVTDGFVMATPDNEDDSNDAEDHGNPFEPSTN